MKITKKKRFTEQDILSVIDSKLEESINIEFKSSGSLSFDSISKKEMSKDVAAMANSDGGIIFYGIKEIDHVASQLSFINGREITKEWIENVLTSNIQPKIDDLRIIPVRFGNDLERSIYVVIIGRSPDSPHMNSDKKYYKRYNFQSVPMEEYEVRGSYLKDHESKVIFSNIQLMKPFIKYDIFRVDFHIQISNEGRYVAERYKVACWLKLSNLIDYIYPLTNGYDITIDQNQGLKFSTTRMVPIFPNEFITCLTFTLEVPRKDFYKIIKGASCDILVFSLKGKKNTKVDIEDLLADAYKMELTKSLSA
ncbi:AlbA family DNA-binding domain-containing protein [Dyadobacter sediminis]|uniref:AlbA family DNA-binding domain-containing protein n=1 Tax=Dyadobacter sediminis TaxID=1493691 RepID=UPI001487354D|nr:ATP-binding protein [Dyadobacter sediminis]GGB98602.1 hypothetical protein GCM10011325_27320 [Dyadobacter sediminis]